MRAIGRLTIGGKDFGKVTVNVPEPTPTGLLSDFDLHWSGQFETKVSRPSWWNALHHAAIQDFVAAELDARLTDAPALIDGGLALDCCFAAGPTRVVHGRRYRIGQASTPWVYWTLGPAEVTFWTPTTNGWNCVIHTALSGGGERSQRISFFTTGTPDDVAAARAARTRADEEATGRSA